MRLRALVLPVLLSLFASGLAAAAPGGRLYSQGPVPKWVDEQTVSLDVAVPEASVRGGSCWLLTDDQLNGGRPAQTYRHRVLKLFSSVAVQESSRLSFEVDPVYEKLLVHHVTIRRDGRTIDALRTAETRIVQSEEELDDDLLNGRQTVLFLLRDVRAGDVLDWSYTVTGKNPVLGDRFADSFLLARGLFTARLRARVVWPGERPLLHATSGTTLDPKVSDLGGAKEYRWQRDDVPGIDPEDRLPSWYEPVPEVQLTDFASWGDVAAWAVALYAGASGDTRALEELAKRFLPIPKPEERALAAIRFVQDEIRYLGLEEGTGSHRPRAPGVVLARRFGDCKDKALLTVALLSRLGVEAHPALVNTSERGLVERRLPSPYDFDHVIVRLLLDGKAVWVDPTASHQGGSLATVSLPRYERALLVREGTNGLVPVPFEAPAEPTRVVKERFVAPAAGKPGTLSVRTILTGTEAERARARLAYGSLDDLARSSRERYEDDDPDVEQLKPPVVKDERALNRLEISEEYRLPTFWTDGERSIRGWAVERYLASPRSSRRTMPLAAPHPVFVSQTVELDLPESTEAGHDDVKVESPSFAFAHSSVQTGRTVTVTYSYRSLGDSVDVDAFGSHLAALKKAERVLVCDVPEPGSSPASGSAAVPGDGGRTGPVVAAVLGLVVVGAGGAFAFGRLRLARRRRSYRKLFRMRLGESPATAIPLTGETDFAERLGTCRCPCGRPVSDHATSQESAFLDGRRLVIVTPECPGRADVPSYYFTLPGDATGR